jgi:hypothetical protein
MIAVRRLQASGQRMALDDAFHIAHHLLRESEVAGQHENAQVRMTEQQPRAEQADQSRLAGAAEGEQQQLPFALLPAGGQPSRDLQMYARRRLALSCIPDPDELGEARVHHFHHRSVAVYGDQRGSRFPFRGRCRRLTPDGRVRGRGLHSNLVLRAILRGRTIASRQQSRAQPATKREL